MEVDVGAEKSDYMLSTMELTESREFNIDVSETSEISSHKDSLINLGISLSETPELQSQKSWLNNLSITLNESETAKIQALELKEKELEAEYARLGTIQEESVETITLMDESGSMERTETTVNDETNLKTSNESEEIFMDSTLQHADERSFFKHTLLELGRRIWKSTHDKQHYTKGCLWSPDGTCILVPVHLDGMHVMELPQDLYNMNAVSLDRHISKLATAVHVKEGGTVYDMCWYPFMNSGVPETCCWLATRQHEPIHLFDAFNGELRCSYRGYDQVDEVEAAVSVVFSNNGEKVFGGYKKSLKIFDTNIPGRDYDSIPVKKTVACFGLRSQNDETVTTGSWNGYIDHYDLRARNLGSLFTLGGHDGGITWLKYSKTEPLMLLSGARRDNKILQWDMRNFERPLQTFKRTVNTNQRVYFDLSPQEEWLISGDCDGLLRIWDLTEPTPECVTVPVHKDCCNGANFHPTLPILATSAGQYHFADDADDAAPSSENAEQKIVKYENSVIILGLNAVPTEDTSKAE